MLLLAGCSAQTPAASSTATRAKMPTAPPLVSAAPAPPPRAAPVLLIVIVDQLASWVFEARKSSLSRNGAFAELMRDGIYIPELRYEHATTSTAPGHAALFTGAPPRDSGVFANERLDEANKAVSVFADASTHVVLDGTLEATSSSAELLRAPTLADALRAQRPEARIISVSLKDRAAIPGGGKRPDAIAWFDPHRAAFVTSTAFHRELPAFVRTENAALDSTLSQTWKPLDDAWLAAHAPTGDEQLGEGDFGLGTRFPYALSQSQQRATLFRGYPAADQAVLALARGALDQLAPGSSTAQPVLLTLSLSALDYVGHVHGPDSWESWELLRELDLALKSFFVELEQRFGDRLAILLTADHGTSVLPETAGVERARPWCQAAAADAFERPCTKGQRLYRDELEGLLRKVARATLGPGDFVRGVVEPFVYFTPAVSELPRARRSAFERAAVAALEKHPGIARVFVTSDFSQACPAPPDESLGALVCRSLPPGAGQLYVVARPGSFFDPNLVRGRGINHGSPYLYDRTVPLFIRARDHARAGTTLSALVRPADFTATAAALLEMTPPGGAVTGRDLVVP